jgi:hypothetical protein
VPEHREFWPLVNRRAHPLGGAPSIESTDVRRAWRRLLAVLARRRRPDGPSLLQAAVLMLAQDRIDDAVGVLRRAEAALGSQAEETEGLRTTGVDLTRMQRKYAAAWLALADPDTSPQDAARRAADIAAEERGACRDVTWASRWDRLSEVAAEALSAHADDAGPGPAGAGVAAASVPPSLCLEEGLGPREVVIRASRGIGNGSSDSSSGDAVCLRAFKIDVELLLSSSPSPFEVVRQLAGAAAPQPVAPHAEAMLSLPDPPARKDSGSGPAFEESVLRVQLSQAFPNLPASSSVVLEACYAGLTRTLRRLGGSLRVRLWEERGELQALVTGYQESNDDDEEDGRRDGKPVAAAYVKVWARRRGGTGEGFLKDGYTDVRGKFDYFSTTGGGTDGTAGVGGTGTGGGTTRLAVLVHHPELGACVVEAAPPPWAAEL